MLDLYVMLYMTVLGTTMVLLFMDSRFPQWVSALAVYGTTALLIAAVIFLYDACGIDTLLRYYTLIVHLPALLLFFYLSRYRGWRLIFQFLSSILFCSLIQHGAGLVYYLSGHLQAMLLAYLIFTTVILIFLIHFLRPLFFRMLLELHHGWWLLCLVMAAYYVIIIYLIPGYVGDALSSTIIKPVISFLMVGFYSVTIFFFSSTQKEMENRHAAQMFMFQLSALQSRMEAVNAAEKSIRIERHDLRHRLQAVRELVNRGESKVALDFLDITQKRLDDQQIVRWCKPPVLDAIFTSYFDQAKREDIQIDAQIALPDSLPVNEGDLAVVFANALENALHACTKLPQEQREIRCKVISIPSLMFELSNPCAENVQFDSHGLPIPARSGHGLGTRSILAFCQKYGATCSYTLQDNWFSLRIIL